MKHLFSALLLSAMLCGFFSCKNGFDVQQRRYTNGFYVSHSGKKNSVEKQKTSAEQSVVVKENRTIKSPVPAEEKTVIEEKKIVVVQKQDENNSYRIVPSEKSGITKQNKVEQKTEAKSETAVVVSAEKNAGEKKLKGKDTPVGGAQLDETGMFILMLILSLLLPPLAVYLKQKSITKWFWITLILCLLTGGVLYAGYLGSLWFIAFIFALLVVLDILN